MPLRHVVLLKFSPDTSVDDLDTIVAALRTLPGQIPELIDYRVGSDLGLAEGNWPLAVTADVADEAGYVAYRDHPAHVAVIDELIKPNLVDRCAAQYEI